MHSSVPQQTVPTPPGTGQGCFLSTGRLLPCSAPLHGLQCGDVQPQREESTEGSQAEGAELHPENRQPAASGHADTKPHTAEALVSLQTLRSALLLQEAAQRSGLIKRSVSV